MYTNKIQKSCLTAKISLICANERKNLIEFENLSLNLTKWDFFCHKNMGPE